MNNPTLAPVAANPLAELLQDQFGSLTVREHLGPVAASLDAAVWQRALLTPLSEFLSRPGKEFRANLVRTSYRLCGGTGQCPALLPQIVELLHAGSLIVDDIQDESTRRRGAMTLHERFGMPVALNAGNWLYFWALDLIEKVSLPDASCLAMYRWTNRTLLRSHHGQGLDLTANIQRLSQAQVLPVVRATSELKTGALMELSAVLGAVAAGATPADLTAMADFGRGLGVTLQMLDDVGGIVSDSRIDKGSEDLRLSRPTWPWAWLSQDLQAGPYSDLLATARLAQQSETSLRRLTETMKQALHGSGRVRVRRHIHQLFAQLQEQMGDVEEMAQLRHQIQTMEKSYG